MQEAVKNCEYGRLRDNQGKPPGLLGWWPGKAVTFVDNHDTGGIQAHWPFPTSHLELGYAYILTHPGVPCILHEHFFYDGLKDSIKQLISVRKRNGIRADSPINIWTAEGDMYVAAVQDANKNDRVVLKLGPRYDMVRCVACWCCYSDLSTVDPEHNRLVHSRLVHTRPTAVSPTAGGVLAQEGGWVEVCGERQGLGTLGKAHRRCS